MRSNNWSIRRLVRNLSRIFAGFGFGSSTRAVDRLAPAPHRLTSEHDNNGDFR
jgi:hypothetical protein